MVGFISLAFAVSAIATALAAPTTEFVGPAPQGGHLVNREAGDDLPDFQLGGEHLARRQDYNQNYKTGGSVNFSPASNGYSVTFSGAGDFVVGKGWKTGTTRCG